MSPLPFAALLVVALAGCAQVPTEMRYFPKGIDVAAARVWPPLPEVPRYRFAGQLTGEQNFGPAEGSQPSTGEKIFRWLVGLGQRRGATPRVLARPQSGMVGDDGRIYVTDAGRHAVFVFDEAQGKLHIWDRAERGVEFLSPVGIAPGPGGQILVADAGLGRIVRLDPEGNPLGGFADGLVSRPTGLARDPASGHIYVADTLAHDIKVLSGEGRLVMRIGRRGSALGEFNGPTHIAFADGKLYVTDALNARVQILDPAGVPLNSIGRRGLYVGNLTRPKGVAADDDGNVYVVESYYDHLLIFDQDGNYLLPVGGSGSAVGQFFLPAGAWSDQRDRIFIADMFNGRVVVLQYLGA